MGWVVLRGRPTVPRLNSRCRRRRVESRHLLERAELELAEAATSTVGLPDAPSRRGGLCRVNRVAAGHVRRPERAVLVRAREPAVADHRRPGLLTSLSGASVDRTPRADRRHLPRSPPKARETETCRCRQAGPPCALRPRPWRLFVDRHARRPGIRSAMQLDAATAKGRLMLYVRGSVAQFEREAMLERSAKASPSQRSYAGNWVTV